MTFFFCFVVTFFLQHANNVRRTAMAYKEKLEQQDSQRRRKFSTHLDIPDRDILFRSEVVIPFYYGYQKKSLANFRVFLNT